MNSPGDCPACSLLESLLERQVVCLVSKSITRCDLLLSRLAVDYVCLGVVMNKLDKHRMKLCSQKWPKDSQMKSLKQIFIAWAFVKWGSPVLLYSHCTESLLIFKCVNFHSLAEMLKICRTNNQLSGSYSMQLRDHVSFNSRKPQ